MNTTIKLHALGLAVVLAATTVNLAAANSPVRSVTLEHTKSVALAGRIVLSQVKDTREEEMAAARAAAEKKAAAAEKAAAAAKAAAQKKAAKDARKANAVGPKGAN